MNDKRWPLQFFVTLLASTLIQNNIVKVILLNLFWLWTFKPLKKKEILFFVICSLVFTLSNYGALANNVFVFTKPDILLMPWNEIFMWGFYCLNAHRFIGLAAEANPSQGKLLIVILGFSVVFSLIHSEILLVTILIAIQGLALFFFHSKRDLHYMIYFLMMGILVEASGLSFNLWHYPHAEFLEIPLWAPLMWTNIGLIMSQVTTLFFKRGQSQIN